jgi:hypothetical protein
LWSWIQFYSSNYQHNSSYNSKEPHMLDSHHIYLITVHRQLALFYTEETNSGSVHPCPLPFHSASNTSALNYISTAIKMLCFEMLCMCVCICVSVCLRECVCLNCVSFIISKFWSRLWQTFCNMSYSVYVRYQKIALPFLFYAGSQSSRRKPKLLLQCWWW